MGYLRYVLGIQILYAVMMYISVSPLFASENNSLSIASSIKDDNLSLMASTKNDDSPIAPSPEENNNSSTDKTDAKMSCVRDCMRICMKLDNATAAECDGACGKGCKPLLARNEIGSISTLNNSDFLVPKYNKPTNKPD